MNRVAVYALFDGGRRVYVGKTSDPINRRNMHRRKYPHLRFQVVHVVSCECDRHTGANADCCADDVAYLVEALFMDEWTPPLNKQRVQWERRWRYAMRSQAKGLCVAADLGVEVGQELRSRLSAANIWRVEEAAA